MQNIAAPPKFGQSAAQGARSGVPGLVDRMRAKQQMPSAAPSPDAQPMMDEVQVTGQPTMADLQGQMANMQRNQQYGNLQQMVNKPSPSRQLLQARALRGRPM